MYEASQTNPISWSIGTYAKHDGFLAPRGPWEFSLVKVGRRERKFCDLWASEEILMGGRYKSDEKSLP